MQDLLGIAGLDFDALAERLRGLKRNTSIEMGRSFLEVKTEYNDLEKFRYWLVKTEISLSTANRHIGRYKLHEQVTTEHGKETVEDLSLIVVSEIFAMKRWREEKYEELLSLINNGLSVKGVKEYLTANYTEESRTVKNWNFSSYIKVIQKIAEQIDIRVLKEKDGKRIESTFKKLMKLISECTKLNIIKSRQSIRRKIEEINYASSVLNLN